MPQRRIGCRSNQAMGTKERAKLITRDILAKNNEILISIGIFSFFIFMRACSKFFPSSNPTESIAFGLPLVCTYLASDQEASCYSEIFLHMGM